VGGGGASPVAGAEGGFGAQYNAANLYLLFSRVKAGTQVIAGGGTEVFTVLATGGVANAIAQETSESVDGGTVKSFVANPTWSPDGRWVAYQRTFYAVETGGGVLCGAPGGICADRSANEIRLQRIDPQSGAAQGQAFLLVSPGVLPSISPDGHFVAYVANQKLVVQEINPDAQDEASLLVGAPIVHQAGSNVLTNQGDDHRPRWQPK